MKYNEKGQELPDDTPLEIPAGFKRPETLHEMMKRYVRSEQFRQAADAAGVDTEEEANDFEVEDEEDDRMNRYMTQHEYSAMAAEEYRDLEGQEAFRRAKQKLQDDYNKSMMELRSKFGPDENGDGDGDQSRRGKGEDGAEQRGTKKRGGVAADAAKERNAAGGKRGPAGNSGGRVSEGGEAD